MRGNIVKALQSFVKAQDVLSVIVICTYCYMAVVQTPTPELLETGVALVLGYWFARASNGVSNHKTKEQAR